MMELARASWILFQSHLWRTMRTLDRHNIRGTVALNAEAAITYPEIIREGKRRGWEFMGHGMTNSQPLAGLDEAQIQTLLEEAKSKRAEKDKEPPKDKEPAKDAKEPGK